MASYTLELAIQKTVELSYSWTRSWVSAGLELSELGKSWVRAVS